MITLEEVSKLINKFYLDSEKEGMATRPNAILLSEDHFDILLKEMGIDEDDDIQMETILGLDVILAEGLEYPRVIKL